MIVRAETFASYVVVSFGAGREIRGDWIAVVNSEKLSACGLEGKIRRHVATLDFDFPGHGRGSGSGFPMINFERVFSVGQILDRVSAFLVT